MLKINSFMNGPKGHRSFSNAPEIYGAQTNPFVIFKSEIVNEDEKTITSALFCLYAKRESLTQLSTDWQVIGARQLN